MRINHNIASLNTYRQLSSNNVNGSKSLEKLSSGLRINRAGDDAAGLAISEKMRAQIRGLNQASSNAQDAISMIQTAEGALNESHSILQRMRELAVQASNDTNTSVDRGEIQKEINQLTSEVNRIANTTEFNTQKLLNGGKDSNTLEAAAKVTGTVGGVAGFVISAGTANADLANGITIQFNEGATAGAAFSADGKTLTVTLDDGATNVGTTDIAALITATTVNAPAGLDLSAFTVTGTTAVIDASAVTVSGSLALADYVAQGAGVALQIGANESQSMTVEIADMRALKLGISSAATGTGYTSKAVVTNGTGINMTESALDVSTAPNAAAAITKIQTAIDSVSAERSKLGASQNRLEHTINNLGTSSENLTASESRVRDVDMAKEMMEFTKNNILTQAAQAMLAQANQAPQGVLQLLR